MSSTRAPGAIFLDAGGVLLTPCVDQLRVALSAAHIDLTEEVADRAVYGPRGGDLGMTPSDSSETLGRNVRAYIRRLGVSAELHDDVVSGVRTVLLDQDWCVRGCGETRAGMERLAGLGIPMAIVSNAQGEAQEVLERLRLCQVGNGVGVPVEAVVDSGVVGIAKPDPDLFRLAADVLGVAPEDAIHVGDSLRNDIEAAAVAGVQPVHFDPYGVCIESQQHPDVTSLYGVARLIEGGSWQSR